MSTSILDPVNTTTADFSAIPFEARLQGTIRQLVDFWKPHHQKGLTVRHETGRMLNALIGPPSVRQDYGARVLERVSEQIGVSRSELSRMRKFAEVIPDLEAFHCGHAEYDTWTKVKAYLGTTNEKGQPVINKAKRASPGKGVYRSIRSLTKKVKAVGANPTADDRKRVTTALKELAQAVRGAFGVALQVETDQDSVPTTDGSHPGASQAA